MDVSASLLPKRAYICLHCKGHVFANQGPVQVWHFRHEANDQKAQGCDLYYSGHYKDILRDLQTSDLEKAERNKKIRVNVRTRTYGKALDLLGILPTVSEISNSAPDDCDRFVETATLETCGVKEKLPGTVFRASEAEARFPLDPAAPEFRVDVRGTPEIPGLVGSWTATCIASGDVFIGDAAGGERVEQRGTVGAGDVLWLVTREPGTRFGGSPFRMGEWHVECVELVESLRPKIGLMSPKLQFDETPFFTDVVLPPGVAPASAGPIDCAPMSEVLVAIIPPADQNPEMDIVPIPIGEHGNVVPIEAPPDGAGKPRWIRLKTPEEGTSRFSIHWAGRHRVLMVHALKVSAGQAPSSPTWGMSVTTPDGALLIPPWQSQGLDVNLRKGARSLEEMGVRLLVPDGLRFDVEADFRPGSRLRRFGRAGISLSTLEQEIPVWIKEGLLTLSIELGPLGSFHVNILSRRPLIVTDDEIRQRLRSLPELPKKIRWSFVREVLQIPPRTPHRDVSVGRKHIRKLVEEVRKDRH